ncbi:MAG: L-histidine N(alpha)-methyltransferase [Acidimicrobiia bacterium]
MNTPLTIDVHLDPAALAAALREDAARGLSSVPKELSPKWFYDERGSALFEAITHLPEYYPTRRERGVLAARAAEVAHLSGADTLVELGSGASDKTLLLLDALRHAGTLRRVVLLDVSESPLRRSCETLAARYPGVHVHGVVGDFERHLDRLPGGGRRLIAFLGGTIGNLPPAPRARFLASVAAGMHPGDALLLGTDLVKDPARLTAAYDDAAGVTAAFNRNVLAVLNRELGADFVLSRFAHVAVWDPNAEWIEMRLRSLVDQVVTLPAIERRVHFAAGEEMRTEISAKFRRERVETELATAGLRVLRWWTDPAGDFAVSLSVPA